MTTSQEAKNVAKAFYESYNNLNLEKSFADYISPEMVNHTLGGSITWEQWMYMDIAFIKSCPDLKLTLNEQVAEGDKVVSHFTITGTHTGEDFMEIPATGNAVLNEVVAIDKVADGKIVEHFGMFDMGTFLKGFQPK